MKYKIEYIPINEVKLNPNNPRIIKDHAFNKLVKSLKDAPDLFDARPLLCSNRTGELIVFGGNMRLRAAQELKYKAVPVIVIADLTETQEREIAIKDNGSFGQWDFDTLANEWSDFPLAEWGVDIPEAWGKELDEDEQDSLVPEKDSNILIRLSFHPGMWLGKREEILGIFDKMSKTYECTVKVEE